MAIARADELAADARRRLVQGVPRRDLRRRGRAAAASSGSPTPTTRSSTGPTYCLRRLGFSYVRRGPPTGPTDLRYVRLLGGLPERMRFFHTVDPGDHPQAHRSTARRSSARPSLRVVAIEPLGVELRALRHHHRHRRLHRQRRRQPQLLRPPHPHLPRLQRRAGLRARDRRQGQHARGRAGGADAAVVEARARRARDQHRPVPVGRETLRAAARRLGGACATRGTPCSVLTKSPLLLRDIELFKQIPELRRQPVDPDARREGLARQRAAHARIRASGSRRWPSSTGPASRPAS